MIILRYKMRPHFVNELKRKSVNVRIIMSNALLPSFTHLTVSYDLNTNGYIFHVLVLVFFTFKIFKINKL